MFWFVSFLYALKLTWLSLRKILWLELVIIYTQQKKIIKTTARKKFFDSESLLGQLFSKTDNLDRESLSPAAGPFPSFWKETLFSEQITLLKQELELKEEQLSQYQKKAAA